MLVGQLLQYWHANLARARFVLFYSFIFDYLIAKREAKFKTRLEVILRVIPIINATFSFEYDFADCDAHSGVSAQ